MDALDRKACGAVAYGQAVWFWLPDAGVKFAGCFPQAMVAKRPGTPGRARSSRKAIAQGVPDVSALPDDLWAFFFSAHKNAGAVERPAFPAPSLSRGTPNLQSPDANRAAGMLKRAPSILPSSFRDTPLGAGYDAQLRI